MLLLIGLRNSLYPVHWLKPTLSWSLRERYVKKGESETGPALSGSLYDALHLLIDLEVLQHQAGATYPAVFRIRISFFLLPKNVHTDPDPMEVNTKEEKLQQKISTKSFKITFKKS